MRKFIVLLLLVLLLGLPLVAVSAESVTQGDAAETTPGIWEVVFTIQTAADGTMTNTALTAANIAVVRGMYLLQVDVFPTVGGTPPDAASVFLYDENNIYYLGSPDGGTTAYAGLNLIHATLPRSCIPVMYLGGTTYTNYYWPVRGALTLAIADQATSTAHITIILVFVE